MYIFWHNLLADKKGGDIFTLFSPWHFFYIILTAVIILITVSFLKKKDGSIREKTIELFIRVAFGMYIADFFLMPLAYNEIDIEKLPFHVCTAMCVMCFLSCRTDSLKKYQMSFVRLGFISNLVYLIYPAGVMWHKVHPLSYRVIQTLLFHSIMTVYSFLMLVYNNEKTDRNNYWCDLKVTVAMTVWSLVGNYTYNGTNDEYSHFFNWFFTCRDPFNILPETIAPFLMPFVNIVLFFSVEVLISHCLKKIKGQSK